MPDPQGSETPGRRMAVLGPGCHLCHELHQRLITALREDGRDDVVVEQVHDLDIIATYGPIPTPALLIGDSIVLSGRVPSVAALRELLSRHLS